MQFIQNKKIEFVCEQDGVIEREFKSAVCSFIEKDNLKARAYLVRVFYENCDDEFNVALCFSNDTHQKTFLDYSTKIFKEMFGAQEHLDILFLDQKTEILVRKIACPFYISSNNQFDIPDFYLTSSESYSLESVRHCFKRKKLTGSNADGYLLCDISPSIMIKQNGFDNEISQIILISRHRGCSLFSVTEWPVYVHVARPLIGNISNRLEILDSEIESISWGEIYRDIKDISKN